MSGFIFKSHGQKDPKWDDTVSKDWPKECNEVSIKSSVDGQLQKAYFYKSAGNKPRPLVISLHTWSFNYQQQDSLSWQCIKKNYNYIHPDFRGPNTTYEACGSPLVISDIDDAIAYAIKEGNVNLNEIHVIGVSGGGLATLLAYMNSKYKIKSFSAWAPISNLVSWYYQSEGRKTKYAEHIAKATTGLEFEDGTYYLDVEEAKRRSPINMNTPLDLRKNSRLYIYEGVHDGYTGSVPITQSLNMYNKIVKDFDTNEQEAIIPSEDIIELLTYRGFCGENKDSIGGRKIHYKKTYKDKIQLIVFEGGHEMLVNVALSNID
tara:strand:+ start:11145 stop:12101 length:957 start_codon:yes stop_codon:yes gene_type:complete